MSVRSKIGGITAAGIATLGLFSLAGGGHSSSSSELVHLRLERSAPEADQTLDASPAAVTLWFSQAPQMSGTSIRVVPEGGEPLDLGDAAAEEEDGKVVVLAISDALADGGYTIYWRAMAADGHVVRGDFHFAVRAGR